MSYWEEMAITVNKGDFKYPILLPFCIVIENNLVMFTFDMKFLVHFGHPKIDIFICSKEHSHLV